MFNFHCDVRMSIKEAMEMICMRISLSGSINMASFRPAHMGGVLLALLLQMACTLRLASAQPTYDITQVGLTGPGYSYSNSLGSIQISYADGIVGAGQVAGTSFRYSASGTYLGIDAWFYSGNSTNIISLTGPGYSYAASGGTYEWTEVAQFSDAGEVIGTSDRFSATGGTLGNDAWIFNGTSTASIGLTGSIYSRSVTGGTYQASVAQQLNDAGQVMGFSDILAGNNSEPGLVAWIYSGTSTQAIGLTGGVYSITLDGGPYSYEQGLQLNNAGEVIGDSARFSGTSGYKGPGAGGDLGTDAWLFNGTTTQQIGLTGAGYSYPTAGGTFEHSQAIQMNDVGQVMGESERYSPSGTDLGDDAWILSGANYQHIGLTGANYSYSTAGGTFQRVVAQQINKSGDALGYSNRYNSSGTALGTDAWLFNGAGTQQIGLTGNNYSYSTSNGIIQSSLPLQLNDLGQAIGTSTRYSASGVNLGLDTWFFNGATTQQINLTGAGYSYSTSAGTYESSTNIASQLNDVGDVIGTSARFDSTGRGLGYSGWFFDSSTDVTTPLQFGLDTGNGFSYTVPETVTDTGVVLGYYELFDGSADMGSQVFYWSLEDGFHDLGALVNGGLTAQGWQSLAEIYAPGTAGTTVDGSPQYILGDGILTGGNQGLSNNLFLLTDVPEPTGTSLFAVTMPAFLRRRARQPTTRSIS